MHPMQADHWLPLLRKLAERRGRILVLRSDQTLRFDPDGAFHQIPSLQVCLSGTLRIVHANGAYDLGVGEGVLMEPGAWHRDDVNTDGDLTLHIGFFANCTDLALRNRTDWHLWTMPFNPARRHIEAAILAARPEQRDRHIDAILGRILATPLTDIGGRGTPLLNMLHALWRVRHDGNASPSDILGKSGLSRTHAFRLFRSLYGVGPRRAIEITRLDLARWLLFKGYRVGEVAALSGFATRHAFTKRWIAQFGTTPRACRHTLVDLPRRGYASNHGETGA